MAKTGIPRDPKIYLSLFILFLMLVALMPRTGKFNYDYKKGSPWAYETLISQIDFPILKTAEQLQSERDAMGSSVVPYYRFIDEAAQNSVRDAENLNYGAYNYLKPEIVSALTSIYQRGVMADEASAVDENVGPVSDILFIQKDKRASKHPASDVFTMTGARVKLLSAVQEAFPSVKVDSVFNASGLYDQLVTNLVYDRETTDLVHAESVDYISPSKGFVTAGQLIVTKGEIVTAEIAQMLDSYKAEYENSLGYNGPRALLWLGNSLISLAIVLILFLSIFYTNPDIFKQFNKYVYLLFIFVLTSFTAVTVDRLNPSMLYLTPFSLAALFLLAFFKKRVVLPVYVLSLLPLLIFAHNGIELFVLYLVAGVITMYVFQFYNRGWRQFVTAVIVFFALLLTFIGFRLINDGSAFSDYTLIIYLFIGSMLSVAGYPLIYLMEKVFGLVSNSRLLELGDPNNKLLRLLAQKAPGTFQHSLQVMNLADAAARSIDANVLLVRAGAMYHDIGKTGNPQCFIENESMGAKYHEGLSPLESARMIIRHVSDGMVLASKYNLPQVVADFILTHHGTTCTAYFYNKYLEQGGSPDDAAEFYYKGRKPFTKEQTIVMICDSVEAASRTLKDNSPETFDKFVENIVSAKINAGQLDNADISLKELTRIKAVLKSYLAQIYHERVEYPRETR
ncbi:MAG: HDIG domain-containing protein [Bacteroidales bacterium]|nr:HDIG domain-containing protein [Bacteroidales bacterium]